MRWVVCLVLAAAVVAPARADELADALRTLQQRYESTRTLVAKFRQEVESPTMAGKLTSNGTVSFEKPNRMRWDYAAPDRQTIVSDGETLWIYQPEEKQVLKAPLREAFQATTPVTFLGGLGHVDRDFTPTLESSADDRWVLKLVPREERGVGTLVLVVRKGDASIEEARISDPLGTTTHLALSEERRNVSLGADLFHFTPPPGVDVVRPPTY
ncbi:MAG: outer membrane lipoprotein chaperone LolA [Deltaproteobacteria bacterium]|nr:MAG: outer membrane lipoprotein chaperone LolA [Deltaproteobacteria bacterium]